MNEDYLIMFGFISLFLLLLCIPAGVFWLYLRFQIEVKYTKDKNELLITYSTAKVGDCLRAKSSVQRDTMEPI